ncbi:hypothetical protein G6F63_016400 [Rhizopus arrhizus]|nr:hypothetical protein G6F63_016400 [Rhizopus arrhizus]
MTYDKLKLDDKQLLDVFAIAARAGALPMVHAENNDVISWIARHLLAAGHTAPKYHAVSHDPIAENEATQRAISLASVLEVIYLIFNEGYSATSGDDWMRPALCMGWGR